jgi:hypothetical protein
VSVLWFLPNSLGVPRSRRHPRPRHYDIEIAVRDPITWCAIELHGFNTTFVVFIPMLMGSTNILSKNMLRRSFSLMVYAQVECKFKICK